MNVKRSIVVALLMLPLVASAFAQGGLNTKTKLYVGTGAKNNGVVTTNQLHLNDSTREIGYTVDDASATPQNGFTKAFVGNGTTNMGVVTRDANHLNDSTMPIGYVSKNAVRGGTELQVGTGPSQNGVVTTSTKHLNEATEFFGYAIPSNQ